MPTTNFYPESTSPSAGDQLLMYSTSNGGNRRISLTTLTTFMQSNLTFTDSTSQQSFTTQYASPVTGGNVQVTDGSNNIHLILTPTGTLSTLTITLPALGNIVDKQEVLVNSTQAVTTLTVAANGAGAVTGEPSSLSANGFFRLKYDAGGDVWYRVG